MKRTAIQNMTIGALLIAVGILIPMIMPPPFKLVLEPASFTLASHVAIFLAMMISPYLAVAVCIGTTFGFLLTTPLVVAARAASHLIFALFGSLYLHKFPGTFQHKFGLRVFSLVVALVHATCEVVVSSVFYFGGSLADLNYEKGFLVSVLLLVGVGTVIHSLVDFEIAWIVMRVLNKQKRLALLPRTAGKAG